MSDDALPCGCLPKQHDLLPRLEALLHAGGFADEWIAQKLSDLRGPGGAARVAARRAAHPEHRQPPMGEMEAVVAAVALATTESTLKSN